MNIFAHAVGLPSTLLAAEVQPFPRSFAPRSVQRLPPRPRYGAIFVAASSDASVPFASGTMSSNSSMTPLPSVSTTVQTLRSCQLFSASFAPASQNGTASALPGFPQLFEAMVLHFGATEHSGFAGSVRTNCPFPSSVMNEGGPPSVSRLSSRNADVQDPSQS